jgi:hypothetical protein
MDLTYQIARLALRPGDILVIRVAQKLSAATVAALKGDIDQVMPEYRAIILDGGMDLSVLTREQIDQTSSGKGQTPT